MKFVYWNNFPTYHYEKLLEVIADSCTEADKELEAKTGINAVKNSNVGVTVENQNVQSVS